MDPVSIFPAIAALLVAVATSALLVKFHGPAPEQGRFSSIDGLRGYLAFFVFLHHSCIWYFYVKTGQWDTPPSHLYTHFGQSSVMLFFMITGFLFFNKLLSGHKKNIDWIHLYCSRVLRLVPLYLFAVFLILVIVAYLSHGNLNEPVGYLVKNIVRWVSFTIPGTPDLNGVKETRLIIAGVIWSLPYEWIFYFSLPIVALCIGVRPPLPILALGFLTVVGIIFVIQWHGQFYPSISFLGGIAAAVVVKSEPICTFARKKSASILCLAAIAATIYFFPTAFDVVPMLLLSVVFILIASGNTLFGILASPISHKLGELAYSLYLLHGILLFVVFNFVIGIESSKSISALSHWLIIIAMVPALILICFSTFQLIESPSMRVTGTLTKWIRMPVTFLRLQFMSRGSADTTIK